MRRWPRRRILPIAMVAVALAVVLFAWRLYDRPAHRYNIAYESCWNAAALAALGAQSTFAPKICDAHSGDLPGIGHLQGTWPSSSSPGHDLVIVAASQRPGRGIDGIAYVVGEPPPSDNCVFPLGGPWWQLAFVRIPSMSCPRGFAYQGGG